MHADVAARIDKLIVQIMQERHGAGKVRSWSLEEWKKALEELASLAVARHG